MKGTKAAKLARSAGKVADESMGVRKTGTGPAAIPMPKVPEPLDGVAKAKGVLEIPLAKIEPDPKQPRKEFDADALRRLAAALRSRGQLQPCRVRWVETRRKYVLIAGERRWRAAQLAGLPTLVCIVDDQVSEAELKIDQLTENCAREDLGPLELAEALAELHARPGWTQRKIAEEVGLSVSDVSRSLALLELPAEVRDLVESGDLPKTTAYELGKLDDAETAIDLARAVAGGVITGAEAAERSRTLRAGTPDPVPALPPVPPEPTRFEVVRRPDIAEFIEEAEAASPLPPTPVEETGGRDASEGSARIAAKRTDAPGPEPSANGHPRIPSELQIAISGDAPDWRAKPSEDGSTLYAAEFGEGQLVGVQVAADDPATLVPVLARALASAIRRYGPTPLGAPSWSHWPLDEDNVVSEVSWAASGLTVSVKITRQHPIEHSLDAVLALALAESIEAGDPMIEGQGGRSC